MHSRVLRSEKGCKIRVTHVHACSYCVHTRDDTVRLNDASRFLRVIYRSHIVSITTRRSWQYPLIGWRKECSFVLFFELVNMFGLSPRISASTSLLSFDLLLRSILKFQCVGTALMRTFDLYFILRRSVVFSDVSVTHRSSCESCSSSRSFARLSIGLPRRTPASEAPCARRTSASCVGGSEDGAVFGVEIARSSPSCQKLQWSPLEHCAFAFHR